VLAIEDVCSEADSREKSFSVRPEQMNLPDGRDVKLRSIQATDRDLLVEFGQSLSLESRYQRFFSARDFLPGEVDRLTNIDYEREMALMAVVGSGHIEKEVGVARYVRDETGESCDIAIVISDAWQHRGLGQRLLDALLKIATAKGIRFATGITMSTNYGMIRLARKAGFLTRHDPDDATVMRLSKDLSAKSSFA